MKQITCPHCGDTYPDFDVAHACSRGPYAVKLKPKMTERMRQLAKEAGMIYGQGNLDDFDMLTHMPKEVRFAELIVRECMSIAQEYDGAKLGGPGLIIAMRIEQHFGEIE